MIIACAQKDPRRRLNEPALELLAELFGVAIVGQFLGSSPEQMVSQLRVRWIGVEQIADCQAQTRLMMSLPMLRVRDAQLLVGAGVRTVNLLGSLPTDVLREKVARHVNTPAGKLALRGAAPPSLEELATWVQVAQRDARSAA